MKIVVVSTDAELAPTLETFLGVEIEIVATQPADGLMAVLRSEHPDLLIADVPAPDSQEVRILGMVRVLMPDFPIIVVSLYAEELSRFSQGGRTVANALFSKPFDNEELMATVLRLSSSHRQANSGVGPVLGEDRRGEAEAPMWRSM